MTLINNNDAHDIIIDDAPSCTPVEIAAPEK